MRIIGIDLSGPRNFADTCLVSFEEQGEQLELSESREGVNDSQILETIVGLGPKEPIVVGIDAPLSYNPTGGERPSDTELRRLVQAQGVRVGIMSPTMIRMVYLTLRGMQLTRLLERFRPQYELGIVEVHPGACMILRGADPPAVRTFKAEPLARAQLLDWLGTKGLQGIDPSGPVSDHYVAACAAALGAWQWILGKSVWRFAADLPYHPYDFAC